jgi:hypothetical protein
MAVNKNFVVKNGIEVATDLIFAEAVLNKVGIGTTIPNAELDVIGELRSENLNITGISTLVSVSLNDLQSNEISVGGSITAVNYYGDGSTLSGITTTLTPAGKTIYVTKNGDNTNDGLREASAKSSIEAALTQAVSGDTIKVLPGVYIETNPLVVPEDVSIEGAELRNCIISPADPNLDLFWVTNGTHITDLSFQGQAASASPFPAIISFKPLINANSDRYFDAARLIRYNLDFIASEAVGYITSTDYKSPALTLTPGDYISYKSSIRDSMRATAHDITRGGNSKCVGAGVSYVGVATDTAAAIYYAAGIAVSCVNNVSWNGNYQSEFYQLKDLSIQADSATGSNTNINSCANVVSAVYTCSSIVRDIILNGSTSGITTTYPGGGTDPNAIPSQGVGVVTKGPYIRNCTNFIPNTVGMRVDGFHADPGDEEDIGVQGAMSVDSYTQYNQGGTGVEIKNGAYAQLVSIFTICTNEAIVTEGGGQCDVSNSNSSFGTFGLVSNGVGGPTSKSIYRYSGEVISSVSEGDTTISISGIGTNKPYTGQVVYFDELYYDVEKVTITNGGSGYVTAPQVTFTSPSGPSGIVAEGIATIENGSVTGVTITGNGRNYLESEAGIVFTSPDTGTTAAGVVIERPLYYKVRSSTTPSSGVSTVSLATQLLTDVGIGTIAYFSRQSLQIVSSHSFEFIGSGNTITLARPSLGGVTITENEVIKNNGGEAVFTSTDQDGNFAIGEDVLIDQSTGTISGRAFDKSLLNTVTPLIIALG